MTGNFLNNPVKIIPMGCGQTGLFYRLFRAAGRFIFFCTMRLEVIRPEAVARQGPMILAVTHLSHLDPVLLSVVAHRRQINWLARAEFFRSRLAAFLLKSVSAICVRRFGVCSSAIRQSIGRLAQGGTIGICPEGGVSQGESSVMRGGPIKKGACLISCRTGAPVLPCVILGSDKLNRVRPWLPFRRNRLCVAFAESPIYPPVQLNGSAPRTERRAAREAMADELSRQYQQLFRELLETFRIEESWVP